MIVEVASSNWPFPAASRPARRAKNPSGRRETAGEIARSSRQCRRRTARRTDRETCSRRAWARAACSLSTRPMSLSIERSQTTPKTSRYAIVAQSVKNPDVAAEQQEVVSQRHVEVVATVMSLELLLGFLGEAHRPRHVGRPRTGSTKRTTSRGVITLMVVAPRQRRFRPAWPIVWLPTPPCPLPTPPCPPPTVRTQRNPRAAKSSTTRQEFIY